jgi:aerobic-type carbon monoxide dehydrogenase small subunit (CoxS/CutS family)
MTITKTTITLRFLPDNITTEAQVGEPLLEVAARVGITIPTGCCMGSCHACEVEMDGEPVCSCITGVPPVIHHGGQDGTREVTIELYTDPAW